MFKHKAHMALTAGLALGILATIAAATPAIAETTDTATDEYIPYDTYKSEFGDYDKIIPVIGTFHNPSREEIQSLLDKTDYNLTPNSKGEGIVIKNYKFRDTYGHIQIAKIV